MPELALHILDLVQNSISAGATHVLVSIVIDTEADTLTLVIQDDGCGMTEEFLARVVSPFTTSRTTRKVGLGIPMIKQLAEMCEGDFEIESRVGEGTRLQARFQASHLDLPPVGDLPGTICSLLLGCPEGVEFRFLFGMDGREFELNTSELREALGGVPLNEPEILDWVRQYAAEGMAEVRSPEAEEE